MTKSEHKNIAILLTIMSLLLVIVFAAFLCDEKVYAEGEGFTLNIGSIVENDYDISETLENITSFTYADLTQFEETGYDYEYYYRDESNLDGQLGEKIVDEGEPFELLENKDIVFVRTIQTFTLRVYDSFDLTNYVDYIAEYGSILVNVLSANKTSAYHLYFNTDGTPAIVGRTIDSDIDIVRLDAYTVNMTSRLDSSSKIILETLCLKDATFNLKAYSTEEKYNYHYFYYDSATSTGGDEIFEDEVTLSECPFINNDVISFVQVLEHIDVLVSNDLNDNKLTVHYLEEYGTLFPSPTKTGYTFDGWYLNGEKITEESIVDTKEPHSLTAKFNPNKYTVTFITYSDVEDKQQIEEQVFYDSKLPSKYTNPQFLTKRGYQFAHWEYNGVKFDPSKAYSINGDATIEAIWSANEYTLSIDFEAAPFSKKTHYDEENIDLNSTYIDSLKESCVIFGAYFVDDNNKDVIVAKDDLIIPKWTFTQNAKLYLKTMQKEEFYKAALEIEDYTGYNYTVKLDDKAINEASTIKSVGYHNLAVLGQNDEVIFSKKILIKEDIRLEDGKTYKNPISILSIDATIKVDGVVVNPASFRIDTNGTHKITVVGTDGYENVYTITYQNDNLIRAWVLFGIAGFIMLGILALAIVGRRKVVRYAGDRV